LALADGIGTIQTSYTFDPLDAGNTSIHAMSGQLDDGSYQTPDQAYEGAANVVDARNLVDANDPYVDPFAMHTIEDSYSSSHNYQPDTSTWTGLFPHHVLGDAF
jgi:hypothetical protein